MTSTIVQQWQKQIVTAAKNRQALRIVGGGSKDFYGQSLHGEPLSTRDYAGIVDYEPTELVITARCGTPLAELETALAKKSQSLPWEPPRFPGATVGGMVASGLSGPQRIKVGAVRDFVLGCQVLDGNGDTLRFGGQVMKNVAGYDVSRLMAGSLGTLGLILEVSLKVLPTPTTSATLRLEASESGALEWTNTRAGEPLPISATCWSDEVLFVRLSGARAAVQSAIAQIGGEAMDQGEAEKLWDSLRDQTHAHFSGDEPLWRLSVSPTAASLDLPARPLIEWGGALRWYRADLDPQKVRVMAGRAGGHATLYRGDSRAKQGGVFQSLSAPLEKVHRRLKSAMDPQGIFNPGRLYADF
jgi:glycolate oxidase FAD binding subunit